MSRRLFDWWECTSSIRQLAYDMVPNALDEYLQMSEKTSRLSLDHFCNFVMENFGPEYLRKPTHQSPLFHGLKEGKAPEILFVANCVTYPWGYYLVDGIYSELATLVKMIPEPYDDDYKRIKYKQMQESARKDVKR
ncbi:ALP1-like protein [Tanacetum coccineum]